MSRRVIENPSTGALEISFSHDAKSGLVPILVGGVALTIGGAMLARFFRAPDSLMIPSLALLWICFAVLFGSLGSRRFRVTYERYLFSPERFEYEARNRSGTVLRSESFDPKDVAKYSHFVGDVGHDTFTLVDGTTVTFPGFWDAATAASSVSAGRGCRHRVYPSIPA